MSPESPRFGGEAKPNDNSDKSKNNRKKRSKLASPLISLESKAETNVAVEKPVPPRFSEALSNLLNKEKRTEVVGDKAAKKDAKSAPREAAATFKPDSAEPLKATGLPDGGESQKSEVSDPNLVQSEDTPATKNTVEAKAERSTETAEPTYYEKQEKLPNQIGIEGLLTLDTEEVQVIPLRAESAESTEVAETTEENTEEPTETPLETSEAPIFYQQPEQHQGRTAEVSSATPEPRAGGAGGGRPPIDPPELPTPTPGESPEPNPGAAEVLPGAAPTPTLERPLVPEWYGPTPTFTPATRAETSSEAMVPKRQAEKDTYYATKAAQNRGVIAGLFVGGLYEHFKHKRREKRQAKELGRLKKNLLQAEKETAFNIAQHRQEQAATNARFEQALIKQPERLPRPEKQPSTIRKRFNQEIVPEQLEIPEDHRIETSAWHSIEVDAKTGKAVEKPTFQYGHEYYRERAHEISPVERRNAAAGEVALVAAAAGTTAGSSSQQPNTPDASHPNKQQTPAQRAKSALTSVAKTSTAAGPLWPWVTALVIVALCIVAVITR